MATALRRITLFFAAGLLVAAFATFGLFAWPQWSRARSAASWPVVEGTVVRCEVVTVSPSRNRRGGGPMYELDLLVRYEVDGVTLVTDRDGFDPVRSSDPTWYRDRARELRPGSTVPVRYDPADPGFAVLRAEGGWIPFVLPGGFLLVAIFVALVARFAKPLPLEAIELPRGFRRFAAALLGFLSLMLVVFGIVAVFIGFDRVRTLGEAATWPEREATVVQSEWSFESMGQPSGPFASARPMFAYRYEIDGTSHESDAIAPVEIDDRSMLAWNRRILAWRPGGRVAVRVDPADPARSALEVPGFGTDGIGLGLAVGFAGMGAFGLMRAIRIFRTPRREATG